VLELRNLAIASLQSDLPSFFRHVVRIIKYVVEC
jgi:hypothetical protein